MNTFIIIFIIIIIIYFLSLDFIDFFSIKFYCFILRCCRSCHCALRCMHVLFILHDLMYELWWWWWWVARWDGVSRSSRLMVLHVTCPVENMNLRNMWHEIRSNCCHSNTTRMGHKKKSTTTTTTRCNSRPNWSWLLYRRLSVFNAPSSSDWLNFTSEIVWDVMAPLMISS